jgi:hypothetical protein
MTETTIAPRAPRSLLAFLRDSTGGSTRKPVSAKRGKKMRGWDAKRGVAIGLVVLIPLVALLSGVVSASAAEPDKDDVLKYSFYKAASSTTAFFSTVQEPGSSKTFSESWDPIIGDPGSAGSLLGYADPAFSSVSGWLASKLSGSSDAIGYETLLVRDVDGNVGGSEFQGLIDYAYFGAALQGMGLDNTSTGLSLGFMNVLSGGIVMMLYVMSGAVDFVFNAFVGLLEVLNPFKLFYIGVNAISPVFAQGMVGGTIPEDSSPLSGLASWIGGWYQVLNSLSWGVMVPIFLAILLFGLLMFKKMDRGSAIKKYAIRIAFIGVGLPLLGTMYTGMVSSMADATSSGNAGSTRVVMSTYVDFENWVMKARLAIPDGGVVEWDTKAQQASGKAQANVRNTTLAINNQTHGLGIESIVTSGSYDATFAKQIMSGRTQDAVADANAFGTTVDMLARFMGNSQISAATFETAAKGSLTQSTYYRDHDADVTDWFQSLGKSAEDLNKPETNVMNNPLVAVRYQGGLRGDGGNVRTLTSDVGACLGNGVNIATLDEGKPRQCNLAPLAMFNYLNTDFGSTSMTMYSSSNAQSEATRSIHNSVNQVGTGTMSFLYWFNTVVLLGSFVLIGLGYAFSLVFSSIRRSIQIIAAVPFASIGALAAIAKVVVYTVALILEVILTVFTYKMVQEFLTSLPQIIEMPFAEILNNGGTGAVTGFVRFLTGGWAFSMVITLLSIIGIVSFTVLAMRIRKTLVKAVEEAVTKLVEKFMEASVGMPGAPGGGKGNALMGGLAAGAGAATANRMMSGGMGKGAVAHPVAPRTGGGGPEGVTTASGTSSNGPGPSGSPMGPLSISGAPTPAVGNGDPGSPLAPLALTGSKSSPADEVSLGRDVEANGLSSKSSDRLPDLAQPAGFDLEKMKQDPNFPAYQQAMAAKGYGPDGKDLRGPLPDPAAQKAVADQKAAAEKQDDITVVEGKTGDSTKGEAGAAGEAGEKSVEGATDVSELPTKGDMRAPEVAGDDVMDTAADATQESMEGYQAADAKKLAAGKEGAVATGHAAVAFGRGVAGDAAGAAEHGGKALDHGGKAAAAGQEGKQAEADAGRSSLDAPDNSHAEKAEKAQQVSQVGSTVSSTAGLASGSAAKNPEGAAKAAKGSTADKTTKGSTAQTATKGAAQDKGPTAQGVNAASAPKPPTSGTPVVAGVSGTPAPKSTEPKATTPGAPKNSAPKDSALQGTPTASSQPGTKQPVAPVAPKATSKSPAAPGAPIPAGTTPTVKAPAKQPAAAPKAPTKQNTSVVTAPTKAPAKSVAPAAKASGSKAPTGKAPAAQAPAKRPATKQPAAAASAKPATRQSVSGAQVPTSAPAKQAAPARNVSAKAPAQHNAPRVPSAPAKHAPRTLNAPAAAPIKPATAAKPNVTRVAAPAPTPASQSAPARRAAPAKQTAPARQAAPVRQNAPRVQNAPTAAPAKQNAPRVHTVAAKPNPQRPAAPAPAPARPSAPRVANAPVARQQVAPAQPAAPAPRQAAAPVPRRSAVSAPAPRQAPAPRVQSAPEVIQPGPSPKNPVVDNRNE